MRRSRGIVFQCPSKEGHTHGILIGHFRKHSSQDDLLSWFFHILITIHVEVKSNRMLISATLCSVTIRYLVRVYNGLPSNFVQPN